jgi:hypothetical protein
MRCALIGPGSLHRTSYPPPERIRIEKLTDLVRAYEEQILPRARQLHGFKSAQLWADAKSGQLVGVTFWATEADAWAAGVGPVLRQFQAMLAPYATGPYSRHVYKVMLAS